MARFSSKTHLLIRLKTSNIITNSPHITPLKLYMIVIGWGWGCGWGWGWEWK